MRVTFRLMQASGIQGPRQSLDLPDGQSVEQAARAWAQEQTGHPWDVLTAETEDGQCVEISQ